MTIEIEQPLKKSSYLHTLSLSLSLSVCLSVCLSEGWMLDEKKEKSIILIPLPSIIKKIFKKKSFLR